MGDAAGTLKRAAGLRPRRREKPRPGAPDHAEARLWARQKPADQGFDARPTAISQSRGAADRSAETDLYRPQYLLAACGVALHRRPALTRRRPVRGKRSRSWRIGRLLHTGPPRWRPMELFTLLFGDLLAFVYHCFDRIVIYGYLSGLSRPEQVVHFFRNVVGVAT